MGAKQFITCEVVVEIVLAEPDDLEIPAVMVVVANYAFLRLYVT